MGIFTCWDKWIWECGDYTNSQHFNVIIGIWMMNIWKINFTAPVTYLYLDTVHKLLQNLSYFQKKNGNLSDFFKKNQTNQVSTQKRQHWCFPLLTYLYLKVKQQANFRGKFKSQVAFIF